MASAFSPFTRRPVGPRTAPLPLRSLGYSFDSSEAENAEAAAGRLQNGIDVGFGGIESNQGVAWIESKAIKSIERIAGAQSGLSEKSRCVQYADKSMARNERKRGLEKTDTHTAAEDTNSKKTRGLQTKCEHGRRRSLCKECGGSSICEHGRRRPICKECGGSSICEHGRERSKCTECGGSSICEHGRQRSKCKVCGGSSICEHGRQRPRCKECGGSSICEHGRERSKCKECGGSSICEHSRRRSGCKECGGSSICEHGRQKSQCKECGGSSICGHGRLKRRCKCCRRN
jgi:hypothetical protein